MDEELNLALAEESSAIMTASEEKIPEVPEVNMPAAMVTIEPPESATAIEVGRDEPELVLQEVEPVTMQPDVDDHDIIDEPAPKVGFVKRWTRKIVGWVKRVFKWGKS